MSIGHPPEPWEAIRLGNVDYRSEHDVSIEHSGDGTVIQSIDKWTAERIVACVNALAGVPTEEIAELVELGKVRVRAVRQYLQDHPA